MGKADSVRSNSGHVHDRLGCCGVDLGVGQGATTPTLKLMQSVYICGALSSFHHHRTCSLRIVQVGNVH